MPLNQWEVQCSKTGEVILFSKTGAYGHSGIRIGISKKTRTLDISGWFDSMVGIEGATISMAELEELFKPVKRTSLGQTHGVNCMKVPHVLKEHGYLHDENDDSPYDVDGVEYCGRCRREL